MTERGGTAIPLILPCASGGGGELVSPERAKRAAAIEDLKAIARALAKAAALRDHLVTKG